MICMEFRAEDRRPVGRARRSTKRIQPARCWCATVGGIVKIVSGGPATQLFGGSQPCIPAAWLAERLLLAGDIESNPGPKPTLKTLSHTRSQPPHSPRTLAHQSNPLGPAHPTLPSPPTSIQLPPPKTPTSSPLAPTLTPYTVVVCLPRPMEGMGRLQFSDLFFPQNCQFHHRRLESLEHLMCLIYILLSTTVSHFLDLTDAIFFTRSPFFYISILQVHFACVLCI